MRNDDGVGVVKVGTFHAWWTINLKDFVGETRQAERRILTHIRGVVKLKVVHKLLRDVGACSFVRQNCDLGSKTMPGSLPEPITPEEKLCVIGVKLRLLLPCATFFA